MIKVICVGRLKERFFAEGVEYYQAGRRKERPARSVQIVEVPEESAPEGLSEARKQQITEKEGRALLKQINGQSRPWKPGPIVVALDVNGKRYTKTEIGAIIHGADADVAFVIGGSLGLGQNVLERADYRWSLSAMTLPHQLARVVVTSIVMGL